MGARALVKKAGAFRLKNWQQEQKSFMSAFFPCLAQCMGTQTNHPPPLAQTLFQTCLGQQEGRPNSGGEQL